MDIVQLCEIGMLVAFGFSWPFNIANYSIWFYIADIAMVAVDVALYFRNSALDRKRDAAGV